MRSPSRYPGRASAKATCACRHLRVPAPGRAPPTPRSSSGRSSRCSAWARSRLAPRVGSSAAARVHRSTPPAASSLETAATSDGQVSQYIVGKGSPSLSYGLCSVTVGCPEGQRTTTRLKARGGLPSWASTVARSLSITVDRSVSAAPGLDALDDEEMLAGADVPEASRLACERIRAGGGIQPLLKLALLRRELRHFRAPARELVSRLEPRAERVVVGVADQHDEDHGEPAPHERSSWRSAGNARSHVRGTFAQRGPDPLEDVDFDDVRRARD